jgi:hypothetical protein
MSDLGDRLDPYKKRAQRHKKAAMQARRDGDGARAAEEFQDAHDAIDEAIEEINACGPLADAAAVWLDRATKDQGYELADCLGIKGGIYREQDEINKAIQQYEAGYRLEADERYEIQSTYNTVNRLVVRLLERPELAWEKVATIEEGGRKWTMPELMQRASKDIEGKWTLMTDPIWALADMVLLTNLLGRDSSVWEQRLKDMAGDRFPFDSLGAVLQKLSQRDERISERVTPVAERTAEYVDARWPRS